MLIGPVAPAAAASGATISLSTSSGAVGDTVDLSGNAGCTTSKVTVDFVGPHQPGARFGSPSVAVRVPAGPGGSWSVHAFEIPQFLTGGATYTHAPVSPGTYTFEAVSPCGAADASFSVTATFAAQPPSRFVGMAPTPDGNGYWLAQKNGGVFSYGDARFYGSLPSQGVVPNQPVTAIAATPDGNGYWLVGEDGGVFAFGDAGFYGSLPGEGIIPHGVIVGIASTPDAKGYWLVGADGGVFSFGDAAFSRGAGSDTAVSALVTSPDGGGYFKLTVEGAVPSSGDAAILTTGTYFHQVPAFFDNWFSGMAATADGKGVWRVGTDGGVFTLGDAPFYGSLPGEGIVPNAPIVGIARTPDAGGYWLVGADGGVFGFGDAGFYGSAGASGLPWST